MRQVTGRICSSSDSKASIRLASGGRFFSASMVDSIAESGCITVIVDTARVTLVPAALTSTLTAEEALAINGQSPLADEVAVWSSTTDERCAAIAVSEVAYKALTERLGSRVVFTSPLLATTYSHGTSLAIEVCEKVCYLRLYNNGLQIAEALEVESYDELLYYVANILNIAGVSSEIPIYILGSKAAAKTIRKYYNVICE